MAKDQQKKADKLIYDCELVDSVCFDLKGLLKECDTAGLDVSEGVKVDVYQFVGTKTLRCKVELA